MLKPAKILYHKVKLEFKCPKTNKDIEQLITNPEMGTGNYYEDWSYKYITFKCKECCINHTFEI